MMRAVRDLRFVFSYLRFLVFLVLVTFCFFVMSFRIECRMLPSKTPYNKQQRRQQRCAPMAEYPSRKCRLVIREGVKAHASNIIVVWGTS